MREVVTNKDIYNLCQMILDEIKSRSEKEIQLLNAIKSLLEEIYEGIKTLSDNDVVIDEKIRELRDTIDELSRRGD
ncbi:MAG: hypothetical protein QXD29_00805 [Thermoplasmata archaeon]